MKRKKLVFVLFVLVALLQCWVPGKMILDRENILATGKAFKFKARPVDPTDFFRGKYLTLDFEHRMVKVKNTKDWTPGETIYLQLKENAQGFAEITSVSKNKPIGATDFLVAKVESTWDETGKQISVQFPFDRYYLEETKAYTAENAYRKAVVDSTQVAYALVMIKDGESVLKDLRINERSVQDLVKK